MARLPESLNVAPTGRHGLPADVVAVYQRERLLAATIELVAKRGYRGTSTDHIVKRARVGYVAFYELFEGKEDCFLAAFDRIVSEARSQLAEAIPAEAPWPEQVCAVLKAAVELIGADPGRARVGLVEVQAAGPIAYAHYEAAIDNAIPLLRAGRAFVPASADLSETLEEAVIGGIVWIFHQRLVKGEAEKIGDLLGDTIQAALRPYLGEAEARRIAAASS
jgi:AcrR family transcriptional regulator